MIFDTLLLLAELLALFFAVTFGVFLVQRRLGSQRLRAWMGGSPLTSALKGIAIGFVTPFCTYSAIPMLIGLRQAGVPPAGYVAFITAAPVLDPVILGALVLIIGPGAAGLYTAVAFTAALGLALVAQRSSIETHLKPLPLNAGFAVGSSRRTTETAAIPERLHASLAASSQAHDTTNNRLGSRGQHRLRHGLRSAGAAMAGVRDRGPRCDARRGGFAALSGMDTPRRAGNWHGD